MRSELAANMEAQVTKDKTNITKKILEGAKEWSEKIESPAKYLMPRPDWDEIYKHEIE
jgi:hypothetical protein